MLDTHELVKDAIRYHVIEGVGSKTVMCECDRKKLAEEIVDYIDPNADLSAASSVLNDYIGQYGELNNCMRLGQLIKNMVREKLMVYTMYRIDMQLYKNENA